ncbi:DUF177 domain-containing protein [Blastomonas sp.]|uniref:YceD family protein n=1 Tax=Blastomonas sp. TaxID=1909299 RepID=UPI003593EBC7
MKRPPEFSRPFDIRALPRQPITLEADASERAALAERFAIVAITSLSATATFAENQATIDVTGKLSAQLAQNCAISGEDFPTRVSNSFHLRFVPHAEYAAMIAASGDEFELAPGDLDTIAYKGGSIDLGEAIAQTLALEIDPYAEGPQAEDARETYGLTAPEAVGPFAALKGLKGS